MVVLGLLKLSHKKPCSFCPGLLEHSDSTELPCKKSYHSEIAMQEWCHVDMLVDSAS